MARIVSADDDNELPPSVNERPDAKQPPGSFAVIGSGGRLAMNAHPPGAETKDKLPKQSSVVTGEWETWTPRHHRVSCVGGRRLGTGGL